MHVILTARAVLPGGGYGQKGTVLDLPESEAAPLLKGGLATPYPPAPEPEPEAAD